MVVFDNISTSPSASKPFFTVADWQSNPIVSKNIRLKYFDPVDDTVIKQCHDSTFVAAVLSGKSNNGFGNSNPAVADSLLYTVGSIVSAAKYVVQHGGVVVSPTSGFHHAEYNRAMGYCTFNGLMIAAVEILKQRPGKILILDFDMHYGNGTDNIIKKLNLNNSVHHISSQLSYTTAESAMGNCSVKYLTDIMRTFNYELVIYQAGADIHINDPLGGLLTTEQMKQRDRNIFQACNKTSTPLVWNLAGGYQFDSAGTISPVLELHRNTMLECISEYLGK